ncbi:hypothetical protein P8452_50909 [Trifolium repens]|nr:hypothetical protein P8452_50909 [Trifolium repens]
MEDDENGQNMIFLDCFNYKLQIVTHGFLFVHWICNVYWNSFAKIKWCKRCFQTLGIAMFWVNSSLVERPTYGSKVSAS